MREAKSGVDRASETWRVTTWWASAAAKVFWFTGDHRMAAPHGNVADQIGPQLRVDELSPRRVNIRIMYKKRAVSSAAETTTRRMKRLSINAPSV